MFATIAGSCSIFGTAASGTAVGATVVSSVAGVGSAIAFPAIIIAAVVVAVLYIIQFNEDQSVRPALVDALNGATNRPEVVTMSQDQTTSTELASTVLIVTSPDYTDAERAGAEAAKVGPSQRGVGDPRFEIDGVLHDTIKTWTSAGLLQETFMSEGWFVTRTRSASNACGPWQWNLTLDYQRPNATQSGSTNRIAGIQPGGFLDGPRSQTTPAPTVRTTHLRILDEALQPKTATWAGNQAPKVAPTVSTQPTMRMCPGCRSTYRSSTDC